MHLTPEEFDAIEEWDEDYRYELIDGVLVVNPIPSEGEVGPNELLGGLLFAYREYHPNGRTLNKTFAERYIPTKNGRRRADRVIWAGLGRTPEFGVDVPTIAIEYVSRSKRDRHRDFVLKRDEYEAAGVKEYWIIDRFSRSMTVFKFRDGNATGLELKETDVYTTELLPGFEVPIARVLQEADECSQQNRLKS
jgi:Uma2 family endonuclease